MSFIQKKISFKPLSATNFNLPLLHLLIPEIKVTLKNAETHLSEFYDDQEQAPLLIDSIDMFKQLSSVLKLIALYGVSELADVLAISIGKLYDEGDNTNEELILNISEGVMTLGRYIEFVLLKETIEPTLLIPVINKLNANIGRNLIDEQTFIPSDYSNISIVDPETHYEAIQSLPINARPLIMGYRAGLEVALANKNGELTDKDAQKLKTMNNVCRLIAKHSDKLFWQAAQAVTYNISSILPLNDSQKRTLIFLEQQFNDYLSANNSEFANLVSFACSRENELAQDIKRRIDSSRLNDEQLTQMKHYLYGPDGEVANTINKLIQNSIDIIKERVDAFVRGESENPTKQDAKEISVKLNTLASTLHLINLNEAAAALKASAQEVSQWDTPSSEDFDKLLGSLMISENAAIYLAKSHTPGAIMQPLHNSKISAYQLNTAYETLVKESRIIIATIEHIINDYIESDYSDLSILSEIPTLIKQVSGALYFLDLSDGYTILNRLAKFMETKVINSKMPIGDIILAQIADIILSIDYYLNGYEKSQPVGYHALRVSVDSLNKLLAV